MKLDEMIKLINVGDRNKIDTNLQGVIYIMIFLIMKFVDMITYIIKCWIYIMYNIYILCEIANNKIQDFSLQQGQECLVNNLI